MKLNLLLSFKRLRTPTAGTSWLTFPRKKKFGNRPNLIENVGGFRLYYKWAICAS